MDNKNPPHVKRIIYTIGTSNREIREFIELLKIYGIKILIDIRRFILWHSYVRKGFHGGAIDGSLGKAWGIVDGN